MVAKISKLVKRARLKGKLLKPKVSVNPYAKMMPKGQAKRKFQQRPMRRTITGKHPLSKRERLDKPLRTAKSRYGGR